MSQSAARESLFAELKRAVTHALGRSSCFDLRRVPFSSAARSSSTSLQQSLRMGGYHAYGIHLN